MKKWWESKTLWVNILAIAGMIAQGQTGTWLADPTTQAQALAVINLILRVVTKAKVTW